MRKYVYICICLYNCVDIQIHIHIYTHVHIYIPIQLNLCIYTSYMIHCMKENKKNTKTNYSLITLILALTLIITKINMYMYTIISIKFFILIFLRNRRFPSYSSPLYIYLFDPEYSCFTIIIYKYIYIYVYINIYVCIYI
jgi:hypothetical protein